jgi:hypothetical protein
MMCADDDLAKNGQPSREKISVPSPHPFFFFESEKSDRLSQQEERHKQEIEQEKHKQDKK